MNIEPQKQTIGLVRFKEPMTLVSNFRNIALFRNKVETEDCFVEERIEGVYGEVTYDEKGILKNIVIKSTTHFGIDITNKHHVILNIPKKLTYHGGIETTITGLFTCFKREFQRHALQHSIETNELKNFIHSELKNKNSNNTIRFTFVALHPVAEIRETFIRYESIKNWLESNRFITPSFVEQIDETLHPSIFFNDGYVGKSNYLSKWTTNTDTVFDAFYGFHSPKITITLRTIGSLWSLNLHNELTCSLVTKFNDQSPLRFYKANNTQSIMELSLGVNDVIEGVLENKKEVSVTKVIQYTQDSRFTVPDCCPYCNETLDNQRCINQDCYAHLTQKLSRLIENEAFNLSIYKEVLEQFVTRGIIENRTDLFSKAISEHNKDFYDVIQLTKYLPLSCWLYAAHIPGLDKARAIYLEGLLVKTVRPLNAEGLLEFLTDIDCLHDAFYTDSITMLSYIVGNYEELYHFFNLYNWGSAVQNRDNRINVAYTGEIDFNFEQIKSRYLTHNYYLSTTLTKTTAFLIAGEKPLKHIIDLADQYDIVVTHTNPEKFLRHIVKP